MSEYTAEEYREVLRAIPNMDGDERKKVFGVSELVNGYVKDFSVSELIEKYRAYANTPKTGEYWKRKEDGEMIVIRRVEEGVVLVYYCDGSTNIFTFKYLLDTFTRTEYKSKYLESFIKEMEEVSG